MPSTLKNAALLLLGRVVLRAYALSGDNYAKVFALSPNTDPFPLYEKVRAKGDMVWSRLGGFVTTRREICDSVLRDHRFGVLPPSDFTPLDTRMYRPDGQRLVNPVEESFLLLNPPDHTRLRKLVQPFFTPRALKERAPLIEKIVEDYLDPLPESFDVIGDFAVRVPIQVIVDLLGVPDADQDVLARWGSKIVATLDGIRTLKEMRELHEALGEFEAFLDDLIADRRRNPGTDVVSHLVQNEGLSREDLVATTEMLLVAGFETTVNLIGNGVMAVMANPETREPLIEDPKYAELFVEEVLRLDPPVQYTVRFPNQVVEVGGKTVKPGQAVVLLLAAANRDPNVFENPLKFDPLRANVREHLAFSAGIHYCIGAGLARMEAAAALHGLFRRFPDLRVAGPMKRRPSRLIRGAIRLPVTGTAAGRSLAVN
ncbi:putative cytochrome P450 140 [Lentzea sp. NBRC 105346]|uniref:cytochrome P450 n=1 Tax=Lentzea sp. NBRC 105346 TaxID=3032205 RepID=UPI0024A04F00|nr:cytochrome P450 [Lentzea sp. NBRC 105346]GLZ33544.1 putative cytochrome P450 140 [Lentzea sp. NBRC 105346]